MVAQISVITCSHNSREDYLKQVIDALKVQTLDKQHWEYLLIDNVSEESLESRVSLSWHPGARHVREEKLGLTQARLRGINDSNGEILVFVDDDNVLDPDYLEKVLEVAKKHSIIGAWCGQRRPAFEREPPEWTRPHWGHLALCEFERDSWSNQPQIQQTMPNGAGLCLRRSVAAFYADLHETGKRDFLLDRTGPSLISGGDMDMAFCACDLGLGMGVFTALKLTHLIPSSRLTERYLLQLTEGIGYSGVILRSFRTNTSLPTSHRVSTKVADFLRYLRLDARERRFYRAHRKGQTRAQKDLADARAPQRSEVGFPTTVELE